MTTPVQRYHAEAVITAGRVATTTNPAARADLHTTLCDLRAATVIAAGTDPGQVHPVTGLNYSPAAYKQALATGADPHHLDHLWAAFEELP